MGIQLLSKEDEVTDKKVGIERLLDVLFILLIYIYIILSTVTFVVVHVSPILS